MPIRNAFASPVRRVPTWLVGCASMLMACVPATHPEIITVTPGTNFELAARGTARIAGSPVRVTFDSVTNDSRCPADPGTACVWEGNAKVRLTAVSAESVRVVEVDSHPIGGAPVEAFGFKFELRALSPQNSFNKRPRQSEYVATLRVNH